MHDGGSHVSEARGVGDIGDERAADSPGEFSAGGADGGEGFDVRTEPFGGEDRGVECDGAAAHESPDG